ncbi:hypothetical protein [Loktanella sp. M215]|uniref:hypothetical protein n=1 Tax=Loktanella sp. M215 TaxID=2675431 RepID=UPI001F23745D|nr:hypothetical protein [Loktanella sp. M215]MCF7702227.1 hypothetical protein [Loktanella sp. M215]
MTSPDPRPFGESRKNIARQIRKEAADIAFERAPAPPAVESNGEAEHLTPPVGTFCKSLPHDADGMVDGAAYGKLIRALGQTDSHDVFAPFPGTYTSQRRAAFDVTLHTGGYRGAGAHAAETARTLESPLAGHCFDLEGPDANDFAMPPAPQVGSDELTAEMAELYAMALLRDVPFNAFESGASGTQAGPSGLTVDAAVDALNALPWFDGSATAPGGAALSSREKARQQARTGDGSPLTRQTLFRGSTAGARTGPYISQFLLIGNVERAPTAPNAFAAPAAPAPQRSETVSPKFLSAQDARGAVDASGTGTVALTLPGDGHGRGVILYGQQIIPQKIVPHAEGVDWMQNWIDWLDVQNGRDTRSRASFLLDGAQGKARFIHTPRDLATYVHYDALYQAYLNACLILLGQGAAFDAGLPEGDGHPTRGAFASFGGPHVLTLLTEVATRALKAVRRQKFLIHLRARPEAIAGALTLASATTHRPDAWTGADGHSKPANVWPRLDAMRDALKGSTALWTALQTANAGTLTQNRPADDPAFDWLDDAENWLLPMAFPEGSPVHGSYGAGHATVAGACTTILKAFFEMFGVDQRNLYRSEAGQSLTQMIHMGTALFAPELKMTEIGNPAHAISGAFRTNADGSALEPADFPDLTLQGEIDKLAANIAVGRDFAGVHYYTDYYESLRLGERIAVGMLQEQMLTYREPVSMRFTSFDGDRIMVAGSGGTYHGQQTGGYDTDDARVLVWPKGDDTPPWTTMPDGKARDTAIRNAARAWWTRATPAADS